MSAPTPQPITDWLEKLGLEQYAERFAENNTCVSRPLASSRCVSFAAGPRYQLAEQLPGCPIEFHQLQLLDRREIVCAC
jgi:SAM domain (Sterile alpha motif)